jgi:hypothetical protein
MAPNKVTSSAAHVCAGVRNTSNGDLRFSRVARLGWRFEGFRLQLAIALQQDFNFTFGFFQLLAAGTRELHALIKKLQRPVEGNVSLFQFRDDGFQTLERFFKLGQA